MADPSVAALSETCTCLAIRQAARHVSQIYDRELARFGLRTTQFSVLAKLTAHGPLTVNGLAETMVTDRTTTTRNIVLLEREGLIAVSKDARDSRRKRLSITADGRRRLKDAAAGWRAAQHRFADAFGDDKTLALRALMREVTSTDVGLDAGDTP